MHAPRKKTWHERFVRSGFFLGAVLLHLILFLLVATYVIWKAPPPPPTDDFHAVAVKVTPPPPQAPSSGATANNPQFEPQSVVVPVVTPPSMVTTSANSTFHMDVSKALSQAVNHASDQMAQGTGLSQGSGGTGSGTGNSFFGMTSPNALAGLTGTFYDFTRTQDGKTIPMNPSIYAGVIRDFCKGFQPPEGHPFYKSDVTLYTKFFFFPPIADNQAGKAFKTPSSTEAFWIAHYHGSFNPATFGKFRLVGFGDNLLAVRINNEVVLDASDHGYLGKVRTAEGPGVALPGKPGATPLFMGEEFLLEPGQTIHIDVAVGDEGGIFCAGLFLLHIDSGDSLKSANGGISFADNGSPKLPLFGVGELSDGDKKLLGQYLPPECLTNSVRFNLTAEVPQGP